MEDAVLDFLTTSNALAAEYRAGGWSKADASRLARGQTLMAKAENATTIDELRDVLRDMIRDLYGMGQPVPPLASDEAQNSALQMARRAR